MAEPKQVAMFFHCAKCLKELPPGLSPREWAHLEVGWTAKGVQVWCIRHELGVVHLDFLGQKIDYASSGEV